jgi:hypothetical protein
MDHYHKLEPGLVEPIMDHQYISPILKKKQEALETKRSVTFTLNDLDTFDWELTDKWNLHFKLQQIIG